MTNAAHLACPDCGFVWDGVDRARAISGINDSVTGFVEVIELAGEMATVRPSPERWSTVEYAAHLRDVLISLRERIITAAIVDVPTGTPIHRDDRVNMGFYALDSTDDAAEELGFAAGLISKAIAALPDGAENRELYFSPGMPSTVTVGWVAAQALHEASHHLGDVRQNLRLTVAD